MRRQWVKSWMIGCGIALLWWPALHAAQSAPARAHTTVLVLGDSLSAAYGMPAQQGWVALLQAKLAQLDARYRVVNASISGETSAGGQSRLPRLLRQHAPDLVVIALGANDGLRGLPVAAMEANLARMAQAVRTQGAKLVLIGMRLPPNYGAAYDREFRAAFARVAKRDAHAFVPFLLEGFAEDRALFQTDGVHPTAAAQAKILNTVWPDIERILAGFTRAAAARLERSGGGRGGG